MIRRDFMKGLAAAGFIAEAQADDTPKGQVPQDVTRKLAKFIVSSKPEDLPTSVRKEASRTLLNWLGCAISGSRHETVDIAVATMAPFAGQAQASLVGRRERMDILNASLINGIGSHIFDYDDTHMQTLMHPAGPVASAILALSEYRKVSGRDFMHALVLGIEASCRVGLAVFPSHYEMGWHITGTAGVFGGAAATGKLLGLNEQQMIYALGLAAVQPVGLKEMFGSMTKSYHPGRAAQNGLTSALLALHNYTTSDQSIEAKFGWANASSTSHNLAAITDKLGQTYEISRNTYKPFACGVVVHPTIDGCIQLRNQYKLTPDQIDRIDLRVHRQVLELTAKKAPQVGLEGKFSIYYTAAMAISEGAGGEKQFTDKLVRDPAIVRLRDRVYPVVDPSIGESQVRITITLKDGPKLEKFVEKAVGSPDNPMSDSALEAKFLDLANGVIPTARARKVLDLCWNAEKLASAGEIPKTSVA